MPSRSSRWAPRSRAASSSGAGWCRLRPATRRRWPSRRSRFRPRAAARAATEALLARSARLAAYRRVLAREGAESPADVALLGSEARVGERLAELAGLGVSDFTAVVVPLPGEDAGEDAAGERTLACLSALARPAEDPAR